MSLKYNTIHELFWFLIHPQSNTVRSGRVHNLLDKGGLCIFVFVHHQFVIEEQTSNFNSRNFTICWGFFAFTVYSQAFNFCFIAFNYNFKYEAQREMSVQVRQAIIRPKNKNKPVSV